MSDMSYPSKETNKFMNVQGGDKKVMKKILSVALSTAMAFSMFASVAAANTAVTPQQAFDALQAKGILQGFPDGQAHLDKDLTRAEFATIIAKLADLEGVAGTTFRDSNYANHWAKAEIEAVVKAGYMQGVGANLFQPSAKVTLQEVATVVARILKLETPTAVDNNAALWAQGYVQSVINAGLINPAGLDFKAAANRGAVVSLVYAVDQVQSIPTLSNAVVVDASTLTVTLSDGTTHQVKLATPLVANTATNVTFEINGHSYTTSVTYVVTEANAVQSATASNLKEVEVNFNGTVDKASAEDVNNYTTDAGTVSAATLLEGGRTVRLTLANPMTNQRAYKISVNRVQAGSNTVTATDVAFTPLDNVLPKVEAVTSLGNKAVKVSFSEPVRNVTSSNFQLDGTSYYGSVTPSDNGREVVLQPYDSTALSVGAHKLTVSLVEDYSTLKSVAETIDFTVVEDKEAPVVTSVVATLEKATVTFSEDIDPASVGSTDFYYISGGARVYAPNPVRKAANVYELTFTSNLPAYETTLYVDSVSDYSGNVNTVKEYKVTASVDQTRPEVTRTEFKNGALLLTFSKPVSISRNNVTVTNSSNGVVSVLDVTATNVANQYSVNFYSVPGAGTYNLKVNGVQDTTTLKNTMLEYTTTFSVGDTTPPTIAGDASGNNATRAVQVTFSERMDLSTIGNASNYFISYNDGTNTNPRMLPAGTEVRPVQDGRGVLLIFPERIDNQLTTFGPTGNVRAIIVNAVKDLAGNPLVTATVNIVTTNATLASSYSSSVSTPALLTDSRTVKVKFSQAIGTARTTDFTLTPTANGSALAIESVSTDGSDIVTVRLNGDVYTPAAFTLAVNNPNEIRTTNNIAVTGATVNVTDGVKPVVQLPANTSRLAVDQANDTITLTFSEDLQVGDAAAQGRAAFDLTVRKLSNNSTLTAQLDYTTTVVNNTVVIKLLNVDTASAYTVAVKEDAQYIKDASGRNTAAASSPFESDIVTQ